MKKIKAYIECIHNETKVPFYANYGDAGMDIRADEDISIGPGQTVIIKTGIKIAVDEGIEIQVRPRSGLSCKTLLRVSNSPGTIDCGYRDEIGIIIQNTSKDYYWEKQDDGSENISKIQDIPENHFSLDVKGNPHGFYDIKKGDRIAQLVFNEILKAEFEVVEDISTIGNNRNGGFGSSGI